MRDWRNFAAQIIIIIIVATIITAHQSAMEMVHILKT